MTTLKCAGTAGACALSAVLFFGTTAAASPPTLSASTKVSNTGHYRLSWKGGGAEVVLQESPAPDFAKHRIIYRGPDRATVVSGRMDGVYHYRACTPDGTCSAPLAVRVRHHSLSKALFFLILGALVFLATAALIVTGHFARRKENRNGV
jgi:hypothetical protein